MTVLCAALLLSIELARSVDALAEVWQANQAGLKALPPAELRQVIEAKDRRRAALARPVDYRETRRRETQRSLW